VKRNYPTLTMQSSNNARCTDGTVQVSLTTKNNIPLKGPYTIQLVQMFSRFGYGTLGGPASGSLIIDNQSTVKTKLNATILHNAIGIYGLYRAHITLDYKVWALSNEVALGCEG
jgi:hypothetical protein